MKSGCVFLFFVFKNVYILALVEKYEELSCTSRGYLNLLRVWGQLKALYLYLSAEDEAFISVAYNALVK